MLSNFIGDITGYICLSSTLKFAISFVLNSVCTDLGNNMSNIHVQFSTSMLPYSQAVLQEKTVV